MHTFIFDLDNTLYSQELNVFPLIDQRINHYMVSRLGIPASEVDSLRRQYWKEYGVTLNGLMIHYSVDPDDYLEFVHDVDLAGILRPDIRLRKVLEKLDGRKVIFTNGSKSHAENVLSILGLSNIFEDIFDVRVASFRPKPFPEPYLRVLQHLNANPDWCVMIDDLPENLKTAKDLGMQTILIGKSNGFEYVDHCLEKACDIAKLTRDLQSKRKT
ncbi:pyrimidine 5'-nucleotidase [Desulfonatronovibrio hydrogenovorans]|uniref:pyrimidine 5'-nucleotidase n=1 Tax=Desulfonatronovibrio hydrogenovorans TaxID=53245 RepID=UPI000551273C|nr:pyrimidine 5'-nucleotidase [Desulfonatronovibrio hydrogenovorans]